MLAIFKRIDLIKIKIKKKERRRGEERGSFVILETNESRK